MPRPRLKPTAEQRRLVKAMSAMGICQERIARLVGIKSPKTLRKFFRDELDRGATEATFNMEQAQYKSGMAGEPRAQIDWLRRHRGQIEPSQRAISSTGHFPLPEVITSADLPTALNAVSQAVAQGLMSAPHGEGVARIIDTQRRAIESRDFEERIRKLEEARSDRLKRHEENTDE